jgi:hypothetical protein
MKTLATILLFFTMLPWIRDVRPCPQCGCMMQNWRQCSYFCYTRNNEKDIEKQRPMTKAEKKSCEGMCPNVCKPLPKEF